MQTISAIRARRDARMWVAAAALTLTAVGCGKKESAAPAEKAPEAAAPAKLDPAALRAKAKALFGTPPAVVENKDNPQSEAKVALGRVLFHDARLSKDDTISCNSCHTLANFGVDGEPTSKGVGGGRGDRNSPTVLFSAGHFRQFWDGRAADVEEQAKGPVLNPGEMAMPDAGAVEAKLQAIPGYVTMFKAAFPEAGDNPVTFDNMAKAIASFERTLNPPAPFDAWLGGKDGAMGEDAIAGLQTFVDTGCTTCHNGPLFGARIYQKLGLVEPWPSTEDEGRKKETGKEEDKFFFKVPSLRNVAKTGPYFHDGKTTDLAAAVKLMAKHQLGRQLSDDDTGKLVAFLGALTSELPAGFADAPQRPENGPAPADPAPEGGAAPTPPTGG
ncbi:MAG: hypothetical protein RIT45_2010 [Pseudomonadota bacterium]|jgi:cytochrome c peroxidase